MTKHLPKEERQAQILAAAREEFIENGYQAARISDVAKRANLSKGAIYFHYPSKRELFLALVLQEHHATYQFLTDAETDELPALAHLLTIGMKYLEHFGGDAAKPPRFFLMMTELAVRDPDIQVRTRELHEEFTRAVARILDKGVAEGVFRPMNTAIVAEMLKATIDGYAGQMAVGLPIDNGAVIGDGFVILLRGMLANPELADEFLG